MTNRFYRIGWLEFECLARWGASPARIRDEIAAQTPRTKKVIDICKKYAADRKAAGKPYRYS